LVGCCRTTTFDDLDRNNPPLNDDGKTNVKRRLKGLPPDTKLTILVDGKLPHGCLTTAANLCCHSHFMIWNIWEAGTLAEKVSVETFSDQRTRRKGMVKYDPTVINKEIKTIPRNLRQTYSGTALELGRAKNPVHRGIGTMTVWHYKKKNFEQY
jgi:hypothetical protein